MQRRNKELDQGPGPLDKITMLGLCSGGSRYCDWWSYSFVRLENSVRTWVLGGPLHWNP